MATRRPKVKNRPTAKLFAKSTRRLLCRRESRPPFVNPEEAFTFAIRLLVVNISS